MCEPTDTFHSEYLKFSFDSKLAFSFQIYFNCFTQTTLTMESGSKLEREKNKICFIFFFFFVMQNKYKVNIVKRVSYKKMCGKTCSTRKKNMENYLNMVLFVFSPQEDDRQIKRKSKTFVFFFLNLDCIHVHRCIKTKWKFIKTDFCFRFLKYVFFKIEYGFK